MDANKMESPAVQAQRHFLVDIDMFYDLRIALLGRLSEQRALEVLHNNSYHKRVSDIDLIGGLGIKREEWFGRYSGEFKSLLMESHPTHFLENIIPLTNRFIDENAPGENSIKRLTVNIPFWAQLNDEESALFVEILEERFVGYFEDIRIISKPHEKLIYEQVVEEFTDYFCYNYQDWIKRYHDEEHPKYKPSFRLWAPQLVRGKLDNANLAQRSIALMEDMGIWSIMTAVYAPAFELHWLPVDHIVDARIQYELPHQAT